MGMKASPNLPSSCRITGFMDDQGWTDHRPFRREASGKVITEGSAERSGLSAAGPPVRTTLPPPAWVWTRAVCGAALPLAFDLACYLPPALPCGI